MDLIRQFGRTARPYVVIALATVWFLVSVAEHTDAHKAVTSKYDYNDVFPLLREHCGSCHVAGGPGPMSLMTYTDAVPWAESIRDEVTAGRMPPWPVDSTSPPVKGGFPISARDLDMIAVWASGGTPEGNTETPLPKEAFKPQWKLGPPDLAIRMDVENTVKPGVIEQTYELTLPTNLTGTKWVKAVDLMPGNASVVRDAVISVENGPVLALWEPGGGAIPAPSGAAFRLALGAKIHLQIHYKKPFDQEQTAVADKSTIGLYFTDPPPSGHELQSFVIDPPKVAGPRSEAFTFEGMLPVNARVVALRPMLDRAYASWDVDAITPSGTRVPLLRLRGPRPQWFQRYWLQDPLELPGGSKIEVHVAPLPDYSDEPKSTRRFPLQVALDYVPQ